MPVPRLPVIFPRVLKVPDTVFLNRLPTPYTMPRPPSKGPLTKPSAGFMTRSCMPAPMLLNSPTGFPIKSILPIKKNICFSNDYLYRIASFWPMNFGVSKQL